jgi:hypothetical protein
MTPAPPPAQSPFPEFDEPSDTPSGVHKVSAHDLRIARETDQATAKAQTKRLRSASTAKSWLAFGGAVVTAAGLHFGGPEMERVAGLEKRVGVVEHSATRSETMVEMLVRDRGMRPPPKLDGGE